MADKIVTRLREMATRCNHHKDDRDTWAAAADEFEKRAAIITTERIEFRAQLAEARADSEQKSKRITSLLASLVILRGCPICSGHCKHGDGRVEYLCYPHRVIADCFKPETPEEAKTHFAARKSEESDDGG